MHATRNLPYMLLILISVFTLQSCAARHPEFEKRGIPYTADSFFKAVSEKNTEIVTLFLNDKFDINACKKPKDKAEVSQTAMHTAVLNQDPVMARLLIQNGYDLNNEKCKVATPPLHMAAMRGLTDMANVLIEGGADVNRKDKFGMTPLTLARQMRRADMVDFLKSKGAQ